MLLVPLFILINLIQTKLFHRLKRSTPSCLIDCMHGKNTEGGENEKRYRKKFKAE